MISCSPTPISIIKAALLARIHDDLPCLKGNEESLGLFSELESFDADKTALPALIPELAEKTGLNGGWLLGAPGKALARLVGLNLRYTSSDRFAVIFAALDQALRYGHPYCLCGAGDVSRVFLNRAKAVSHEVHKMLGFIRFQPAPGNTLIAKPKLFHDTADIILRKFSPRYPGCRLVMLLPDKALILHEDAITTARCENYASYFAEDDFAAAWETYYQSQYITARKNSKLASRVVPKKYWDWLAEGKFLEQESRF